MKKSVVTLLRTTAVVLTALCVTARCRPAQQVAAADAVDPVVQHDEPAPLSFGAAAAAADDDDDRGKRQLSTVQSRLLNFLKPLPVVDVTKEEDKYGNNGDKFNRFGKKFIGGVETVSSMLTSALSFPVDTAKKISRSATLMLNNVGARIVGLQR